MSTQLACAIIGLPNVGKSTLFNALTRKGIPSENYPFCTIDPNLGIVNLTDPRLKILSDLFQSKKVIYAMVTFVDIAGLVKGASQGEGLGNQFLSHIRQTDAILHLVRCFESEEIIHVAGRVDPLDDIEVINLELVLADLQMVENILQKVEKQARGKREMISTLEALKRAQSHLNQNLAMSNCSLSLEELGILAGYPFLTLKKVLYVCNVSERDLPSMENSFVERVRSYAAKNGSGVMTLCARLEEELSQLSEEEAREYLQSLGLQESGLDRLVKAAFELLGLITFLTTGEEETRAWVICKGDTAAVAAGKIHSDIEKGFIRAEVISYEDMVRYQSRAKAREAGKARSEGRDYIVEDGDVILFYHH